MNSCTIIPQALDRHPAGVGLGPGLQQVRRYLREGPFSYSKEKSKIIEPETMNVAEKQ